MTRYSEVITLVSVGEPTVDDEGNQTLERIETDVFANRYTMGLNTWAAARANGLHADARFNVRTFDYAGQQRAIHDGIEYEVERASVRGEFTTLVLKRRLGNE